MFLSVCPLVGLLVFQLLDGYTFHSSAPIQQLTLSKLLVFYAVYYSIMPKVDCLPHCLAIFHDISSFVFDFGQKNRGRTFRERARNFCYFLQAVLADEIHFCFMLAAGKSTAFAIPITGFMNIHRMFNIQSTEIGSCDETPCQAREECVQTYWFYYRCLSKYSGVRC